MEAVEIAAHEIAQRVAARRIAREQDHVGEHEDRTQADAEVPAEVERVEGVSPQEDEQRSREDQRVAVEVLDEERKACLTRIARPRVGHRAGRRRPEERPVVRATVVVAGHAESERERDDEDRRRKVPVRPDDRQRRVDAVRADAGRIERGQIGVVVVIRADEAGVDRIEDEEPEHHDDERGLEPPEILSLLRSMTDVDRCRRHHRRWWPLAL